MRRGLPAAADRHPAGRLEGIVDIPKSGHGRIVPDDRRALLAALQRARHLRGERVLYRDDDGQPIPARATDATVRAWLEPCAAARSYSLRNGGLHMLRHTFCSHLAMRGAPAKAIQELAGHAEPDDHASVHAPVAGGPAGAIDLLNSREEREAEEGVLGDILETTAK